METLEQRLSSHVNPVDMLRSSRLGGFKPPIPDEYTNWLDEQRSWSTAAIMFDMSHHMTDLTVRGPDTIRLLTRVAINSLAGFNRGKTKQLVACNPDGYVIGDCVAIANADDDVTLVGLPTVANWVSFQAETGGYDVELSRNEATPFNPNGRNAFRFQLQGPRALDVVDAASGGGSIDVAFFHTAEFEIAGVPVRGLSHTMSRSKGMELFGDMASSERVRDALLEAGGPLGLQQGGAISLRTTPLESGWIGTQVPAIYTGEAMAPYRRWLPGHTYEAIGSLGGSFRSDNIDDYYSTPWALGYGKIIANDHDYIGRSALEARAEEPKRRRVWLRWDETDVLSVLRDAYFSEAPAAKYLAAPYAVYCSFPADAVSLGNQQVGLSAFTAYSANFGGWYSLASVDESVPEGSEVIVTWGDPESKLVTVEPNVERPVKAIVHTRRPA
jgi:vanillate/3-O-methylgallate O-demethylase